MLQLKIPNATTKIPQINIKKEMTSEPVVLWIPFHRTCLLCLFTGQPSPLPSFPSVLGAHGFLHSWRDPVVCSASQIMHVFLRIFIMNFPLEKPPGLVLFSTESKFLMLSGAQVLQLCPTFCDPMDCSPPGSSVPGILQARLLEWIAMPSSRGSSRPRDGSWVCCIAGGFFTV